MENVDVTQLALTEAESIPDHFSIVSNVEELNEEFSDTSLEKSVKCNEFDENVLKNYSANANEVVQSGISVPAINTLNSTKAVMIKEKEASSSEKNEDDWKSERWKSHKKHVFILSSAGKPIYTRYGNEDELATLFGIMQAIVSVTEECRKGQIRSINMENTKIVFFINKHIVLVSVSQIPGESLHLATLQLQYVYNQILSVLTLSMLNRIFEDRTNFDLRRLLAGSERLINSLLTFTECDPTFIFQGYECLKMASNIRDDITRSIISSCQKIKSLLFALLVADNKLISLVRMKKYTLSHEDLHILFNLVSSSHSFKSVEGWTPLCLPAFDSSGYVQAHVSYLSEEVDVCLMLISTDRNIFFQLSEAKENIVKRLNKNGSILGIGAALKEERLSLDVNGICETRHFVYKNKSSDQLWYSAQEAPYHTPPAWERLLNLYRQVYVQAKTSQRPLKLLYQQLTTETVFSWVSQPRKMEFEYKM